MDVALVCPGSVLYAKMGSGKKGKPAAVIDLDTFFANVPSRTEVEKAISELQSFLDGDAGSFPQSSECNRLIQMLNNDEITQSSGYRRVQEAFHLLKTDSAVRKVGLSISSDKAVWDAVLSNKAVQDLRGSLKQAGISDEELDWAATILRWILKITTAIFGKKGKSAAVIDLDTVFHLLKKDSTVRKVVLSILLDEAVWDAVLSNKAVQDLRGSLKQAGISDEELDWAATSLWWILKITTALVKLRRNSDF